MNDDPFLTELDRQEARLKKLKLQHQIEEMAREAQRVWEELTEEREQRPQQPTGVVTTGHERAALGYAFARTEIQVGIHKWREDMDICPPSTK